VDKKAALYGAAAGMLATALSSWIAMQTETHLLRKCFGAFLLYIACSLLFPRRKKPK
jgi:uncharacterized membrane protein YfcA